MRNGVSGAALFQASPSTPALSQTPPGQSGCGAGAALEVSCWASAHSALRRGHWESLTTSGSRTAEAACRASGVRAELAQAACLVFLFLHCHVCGNILSWWFALQPPCIWTGSAHHAGALAPFPLPITSRSFKR